jgi:disulfide bond formation protein DsbB
MTVVDTITNLLSLATIATDGGIILFACFLLIAFLTNKKNFKKQPIFNRISQNGLFFLLVVALTATIGSLFFSEIAGYDPCKLCWFQRILMYPQVLLLGMAFERKDRAILPYVLVLSILGALLAGFHYYLQLSPTSALVPCSTVGISVSCTEREFTHFGYITIPMMALSAFLLSVVISVVSIKVSSKK